MTFHFKQLLKSIKQACSFLTPQLIEKHTSEVSSMVEVVCYNGKFMLDSNRANYSFGGLHTVMQHAFEKSEIKNREVNNVLMLGFGAGSVASILQNEYKMNVNITGVEKDPTVVELAKKYFSLEQYTNLNLHTADAFDFVMQCKNTFDMIVMDVFVDITVPDKFFQEEYIASLGKLLSEKGILFFNLVIYAERIRDKGNLLFKQLSKLVGETKWIQIKEHETENWVFVTDKTKKP